MPRQHWMSGYVRPGKKGPTYVIERWINGEYFHVSTKCRTERAALKQLERFEVDPKNYKPGESVAKPELLMTADLVNEYCQWMTNEKGNSPEWVYESERFLVHWNKDLGAKDLARVSVQDDLKPALDKRKSRQHRIIAIKAFFGWLRREKGLLLVDPTEALPVPQGSPEKLRRRKAVDQATIQAVLEFLPEETRDVLRLQSITAWHVSEVRRFALVGEILAVPAGVVMAHGKARPAAVLSTPHKSGEPTRTPIHGDKNLELAERIKARGAILSNSALARHMREACDAAITKQAAAGVPVEKRIKRFSLGVMRHTVLTWAVEAGATPQEASEFAGHKSLTTTRRFYLDVTVPTVSVPTMKLKG